MGRTLVANFYGGPSSGKSTMCAGTFAWLKCQGINCEMALEVAKDYVWSANYKDLSDQIHVFGQQHLRLSRLRGQVEVVLCDGPLLHSLLYDQTGHPSFSPSIVEAHRSFRNLNFFVGRTRPYNPKGRYHTEEQAKELDARTKKLLQDNGESFFDIPGDWKNIPDFGQIILERLQQDEPQ